MQVESVCCCVVVVVSGRKMSAVEETVGKISELSVAGDGNWAASAPKLRGNLSILSPDQVQICFRMIIWRFFLSFFFDRIFFIIKCWLDVLGLYCV